MNKFYSLLAASAIVLSASAVNFDIGDRTLQNVDAVKKTQKVETLSSAKANRQSVSGLSSTTRLMSARKAADISSLEGSWVFSLGDYYFSSSTLSTLSVAFTASVSGTTVTFTDETNSYLPFVATYDAETGILTFTTVYLGATTSYYIYQQPFVYNSGLDYQDITATYDAEAGTLTFDEGNGIAWVAYNDAAATDRAGYFFIFNLEGAYQGELEEEVYDEEQAGQWETVGTATFVDAWITPSYNNGGVPLDPNESAYEVELQQNVENKNLYRLWKPYKTEDYLLYTYNQSTYDGQIQFDLSDPEHVEVVACGLPVGFKNSNGEFFVSDMLGWYVNKFNGTYTKEQLISMLGGNLEASTFEDGVVTIKTPIFDFNSTYPVGYSWNSNPYYCTITSDYWKQGSDDDTDTPTVDRITYSIDRETMTATVTGVAEATTLAADALTELNIPSTITVTSGEYTVTAVAEDAFYYNTAITSASIPATITTVGTDAFRNMTNLRSLYIEDLAAWCAIDFANGNANPIYNVFPTSTANWGTIYIGGEAATTLEIPEGVTSIGRSFYGFKALTSVTFPSTLQTIGYQAFANCIGLTSVEIPEGVTSIESAFFQCKNLESVTLPSTLRTLGNSAFYSCSALKEITLPASLESIGLMAFCSNTGLTQITCYAETVPTAGMMAFDDVDADIPVYVPAGTVDAYKAADQWSYFTNYYEIEESNDFTAPASIAGEWNIPINDHYAGEWSLGESVVKYTATLDDKTVTFTSEYDEVLVAVFTDETTLQFSKTLVGSASAVYPLYQVPFVNATGTDEMEELVEESFTAVYDAEAGTITFPENSGMLYGHISAAGVVAYWDYAFDFNGQATQTSKSDNGDDDSFPDTESIVGEWYIPINDHYAGEWSLGESVVKYTAELSGKTVTFYDPYDEPLVAVFTDETTLQFSKTLVGASSAKYPLHQVPFVNTTGTDDMEELVEESFTAVYDAEAGTITFPENSGMLYGHISTEGVVAYWDYAFDFNGQATRTYTDGVSSIETESDGSVRYYNLQGIEVTNPEKGIYIKVEGNKTSKVVIR